jgi:hypothetical protein
MQPCFNTFLKHGYSNTHVALLVLMMYIYYFRRLLLTKVRA